MENHINIENIDKYNIKSVHGINILMGKNGCGKSIMMRRIVKKLRVKDEYGKVVYIPPERGGGLKNNAGIIQNIGNQEWLNQTRENINRADNFKEQTYAQFNKLELKIFREQQDKKEIANFNETVKKINNLLDNIEIKQAGQAFEIHIKRSDKIESDFISSGESELISLVIECLIFDSEKKRDKINILFLDEPDIHLHPDLQVKFMEFLKIIAEDKDCKIIIATHSTPILGAFTNYKDVGVCFMQNKQKEILFENITEVYKKILPVFGAHPLSSIFNTFPILILEGEDDVRIYQQVVRSSAGIIKLYPCEAGSKDKMNEMEKDAHKILKAVYDKAQGYSLRDKDDSDYEIKNEGLITRCRLACRNAENLILADETLSVMKINWDQMKKRISNWIKIQEKTQEKHQNLNIFQDFQNQGFKRKEFDLKNIRNDLLHLAECNKPWEVVVGQAIAHNIDSANPKKQGSIFEFLGTKFINNVLKQDKIQN